MSRPRWLTRWWFNQPLRRKGLLVLALPIVALGIAQIIRMPFTRQQDATASLLGRAAQTRNATQELLIALLDLEAAVRGFALTGDRAFLAPFEATRAAIPSQLDVLGTMLSMTGDEPLFEEAAALVNEQVDKATALVGIVDSGAPTSDSTVQARLAESRHNLERIRESLGRIRDGQDALVRASQQRLEDLLHLLRPLIIGTLVGGLVGALGAAWLFGTGISTRISTLERNAERLARGERLGRSSSRGDDEIGSLDAALRRASLLLRTRERELRGVNAELERTVHEQVLLNRELEAFSYSVSHDLRAPLRSIDGFAQALREDWGERMDAASQDHLARVRNAAQRMGRLIDDLLKLSTVSRSPVQRSDVDISQLARDVISDLTARNPTRAVEWVISEDMHVRCDPSLARIVLENLLGNAYKFTSKTANARIEFTSIPDTRPAVYIVRDNGAGFDMKYVQKLFAPFQRLHGDREFPGSGIGLATVQRIVHKHGGEVKTEAEVNRGATFRFTLEPPKPAAAA
jgi:signal transduction histidine kinase